MLASITTRKPYLTGISDEVGYDEGYAPELTAVVIDSRALHGGTASGSRSGYNGHKRKKGQAVYDRRHARASSDAYTSDGAALYACQ